MAKPNRLPSAKRRRLVVEALWQVTKPLTRDPTAFVQFLDGAGTQVAQADSLLSDAEALPATQWPLGYLVRQRYEATGPAATQVRLGLYERESLLRLPLVAGAGALVGPEGDFSPAEMAQLASRGVVPITLGPLVLRCDTAATAALSILGYELQNG